MCHVYFNHFKTCWIFWVLVVVIPIGWVAMPEPLTPPSNPPIILLLLCFEENWRQHAPAPCYEWVHSGCRRKPEGKVMEAWTTNINQQRYQPAQSLHPRQEYQNESLQMHKESENKNFTRKIFTNWQICWCTSHIPLSQKYTSNFCTPWNL